MFGFSIGIFECVLLQFSRWRTVRLIDMRNACNVRVVVSNSVRSEF